MYAPDTVTTCSVYVQACHLYHVLVLAYAQNARTGCRRRVETAPDSQEQGRSAKKLGERGPELLRPVLGEGPRVRAPPTRIPYRVD